MQLLKTLDDASCRTIADATAEYLDFKRESGCKERTLQACMGKLAFLPQSAALASVTPEKAEQLYRSQTESMSAATHHKSLRHAKALFEFCVKRRYLAGNPFKDVRPIGKANAGKRSELAPLKKKSDAAEKEVARLAAEIAKIETALADPKLYKAEPFKLLDATKQRGELKKKLAEAETIWMEALETYEEAQRETA